MGQGNRTQRPKDSTQLGQGNRTQRPKDSTQLGQGNQTQRPYMAKDHIWDSTQLGQGNQTQKTIGFNTVGRKTRPRDHIWAKTIYGIQHSGTGKSDPKDDRIQHSWQENQTQRPYMGFNTVGQENQTQKTIGFNTVGRKTRPKDHIWAKTIYGIQHSGTGKSDPKDDRIQHSWQENQTQRPYMGKDHIWDSTQWDRVIGPKDQRIQHSWDRETGPKDQRIQHSGTGKPDPKTIYGQRPYMGFNTVGQENQTQKTIGLTNNTGNFPGIFPGNFPPWDFPSLGFSLGISLGFSLEISLEISLGFSLGISLVISLGISLGFSRAKTIYGQRPYMGFNTVGQGNQTQRPYMGKDHIWDSTQWDRETGPKDHSIQHSWDRETRPNDHIWAKTIYGIQHSGTGKPDSKTIYGIQHSWDRETKPKDHRIQHSGTGKPDPKTIYRILIGKWVVLMVAKRMYLVRIPLEVGK